MESVKLGSVNLEKKHAKIIIKKIKRVAMVVVTIRKVKIKVISFKILLMKKTL
jgi:hypothetical protein